MLGRRLLAAVILAVGFAPLFTAYAQQLSGLQWDMLERALVPNAFRAENGTAAAPTYSFRNCTGCGIYSNGSNKLNASTAGLFAFQFDDNGQVDMGGATVASGAVGTSTYSAGNAASGRTDTAAASFFIHGGKGTGTGAGGNVVSTVATPDVSTGTTQNVSRQWLSVSGSTGAVAIGITTTSGGVLPVPTESGITGTWRSTTVTNGVGGDLRMSAGPGTGNATPTSLLFNTPVPVASGTGQQTSTLRLTLNDTVGAVFTTPVTSSNNNLGWSIQTGANTACTTTCVSAAVHGWDGTTPVGPTDATADTCLCAGAS